jgi:hypothetical protein
VSWGVLIYLTPNSQFSSSILCLSCLLTISRYVITSICYLTILANKISLITMTETIFRGALLLGAVMALSKKLPLARNGSRDGSLYKSILTKTIIFGLSYSVSWVWRFGVALESWSVGLTLDRTALVHCTCSAYPCMYDTLISLVWSIMPCSFIGARWWSTWNAVDFVAVNLYVSLTST